MKNLYPKQNLLFIFFILTGHFLFAQATLEFASGAGPATSGSTAANQIVTWKDNLLNPANNTFTPFVPTVTVTFALSNQQYALTGTQSTNNGDVSFGAVSNSGGAMLSSSATYAQMGSIGSPAASDFSASAANIGTGISLTANYATEVFVSAMGLYNVSASTSNSSRYYMSDLTVTFSKPVTNPVLDIVGFGGTHSSLGFTSELELQNTTGITLSRLSGRGLNVTSSKILNSTTTAGGLSATTGSGGGSGSVLVTGNNITTLVFKIYMRGDGGQSTWSAGNDHTGDAWLIAASVLSTDVTLPVKMSDLTATASAQDNAVSLQWYTTIEQNSDHFDVEHSTDGLNWESIGTVKAAGNSHIHINYSYIDQAPAAGMNFYRVAEVDLDGTTSYTPVSGVNFASAASTAHISYFPNPTHARVTVTGLGDGASSVAIMSIDGKTLALVSGFRSGGSVDLSQLPAGIYILYIHQADGGTQVVKVQKV